MENSRAWVTTNILDNKFLKFAQRILMVSEEAPLWRCEGTSSLRRAWKCPSSPWGRSGSLSHALDEPGKAESASNTIWIRKGMIAASSSKGVLCAGEPDERVKFNSQRLESPNFQGEKKAPKEN